MNLVGKIFVVLILILSVLFMAFAMAVYATHKNWREVVLNEQASAEKPLGLAPQLRNVQARNKELNDQIEQAQAADRRRKGRPAAGRGQAGERAEDFARKLASLDAEHNTWSKRPRSLPGAVSTTQTERHRLSQGIGIAAKDRGRRPKGSRRQFQRGGPPDRRLEPGRKRQGAASQADRRVGKRSGQGRAGAAEVRAGQEQGLLQCAADRWTEW